MVIQRQLILKRTSLVVQWMGVCQRRGHGFDPWSRKIPCAVNKLKSMLHDYGDCALEPENCDC